MTTPTRTDTGRASKALAASPWAVLAIATITGGLTGPGQTIGVSVFIDHFVDDLNLSRSQVSTAYLIGTLAGATALPFVGRFVDRRGVRIAQVVVGAAFALALVNMSLVNGLVWLAIGFFGIRCLGQGSLSLVATVTVTVAFRQRRGFALGLFSVGTAALMALVPVALGLIIDQVGWQNAWLVSAAAVALFVVPAGWFGLAGLPRGLSQEPHIGLVADVGPTVDRSYTRAEAVRTRSFWIITCVSSTAAMLSTALNFHQIDLLGEAGLSDGAAAAMFIPQVLGSTVAGLAFGYAADRVGARWLPAISMALLAAAHVLAATAAPGLLVVIYAIALGASSGAVRVVTASLLPQWFGTAHIGSIQGVQNFVGVGASALGPVVLAVAERGFGSYPPAVLAIGLVAVGAMVFAMTRDRRIMSPGETSLG